MHPKVGSILQFIGGGLGRASATALVIGIFFVVAGMTPWEAVAIFLQEPPSIVRSIWFNPSLTIVGLATIAASLWFNLWSRKQKCVDELAEDIAWAVHELLNRNPRPNSEEEIAAWEKEFRSWCDRVSKKLENRAFFTRSDQLHFDVLGFVSFFQSVGQPKMDWALSQLRMKLERLRDVINWTQQRRR